MFLAMQWVDIAQTWNGVFLNGARELNPIVAYSWKRYGIAQWVVIKGVVQPACVFALLWLLSWTRTRYGRGPWDYSIYWLLCALAALAAVITLNAFNFF